MRKESLNLEVSGESRRLPSRAANPPRSPPPPPLGSVRWRPPPPTTTPTHTPTRLRSVVPPPSARSPHVNQKRPHESLHEQVWTARGAPKVVVCWRCTQFLMFFRCYFLISSLVLKSLARRLQKHELQPAPSPASLRLPHQKQCYLRPCVDLLGHITCQSRSCVPMFGVWANR